MNERESCIQFPDKSAEQDCSSDFQWDPPREFWDKTEIPFLPTEMFISKNVSVVFWEHRCGSSCVKKGEVCSYITE